MKETHICAGPGRLGRISTEETLHEGIPDKESSMKANVPGMFGKFPDIHCGWIFGWREINESRKLGCYQRTEAENGADIFIYDLIW